jgi:hypothetical protein
VALGLPGRIGAHRERVSGGAPATWEKHTREARRSSVFGRQ